MKSTCSKSNQKRAHVEIESYHNIFVPSQHLANHVLSEQENSCAESCGACIA